MKALSLAALLLFVASSGLSAATWLTDYNSARKASADQNRPILINFTGSDWCGWCIRLRKEVFDTPEFDQYARANVILLEVDFPEHKRMSNAQKQANQALAEQFGVQGYPTLYLLDPQGKPMKQLGYMPGGPSVFIAELRRDKTAPVAANAPRPAASSEPEPSTVSLPLVGPAAKITYDKLILKGITGSATRPLALINNKTFSPGDTLKVQVGEKTLKVRCESITPEYVLVQVDEEKEARKLVLGAK